MKNVRSIFLLASILIMFISCGSDGGNSSDADYDSIANEFCNCMQPLVDINKKIKDLLAEKKQDEVEALFPQARELSIKSQPCVKKLESSLAELTTAQQSKAGETMRDVCPDVAKMVTSAEEREAQ